MLWAAKGWAGWKAPALYLVPPVIWSGIFLGAALVITLFFPAVGSHLRDSGGFWWGSERGRISVNWTSTIFQGFKA